MEEQQEVFHKPYKINEGDIVTVVRNDVEKDGNKWTFYKVALHNKADDTQTYYKNITFPKDTDLKDGTRVKIITMYENARHLDKFRDTFYLYIDEFEIIPETTEEAVQGYKEELDMNNDFIF